MALCVFDLDNTLGDFGAIDFFGMIFEPKCLLGYPNITPDKAKILKNEIEAYDENTKKHLITLRDTFEKTIAEDGFNDYILRPKLKDILTPLVKEYKKGNINGFIIYSNNANMYALTYAGRAIQHMFNAPDLFIKYIDRMNDIRDDYDKNDPNGYRVKTVATIKKLYPYIENKKILFVDDVIHPDFVQNDVTYLHIPRFISNVNDQILQDIWKEFRLVFDSMPDFHNTFFNLYHIKNYLQYTSIENIRNAYMKYSTTHQNTEEIFEDNLSMIKSIISGFTNSLNKKGGKRKSRRFKTTRKRAHKRKYALDE